VPEVPDPTQWEAPGELYDEATLNDFLFAPVVPQQEEEEVELTPQERHHAGFEGERYQGPQLGGKQDPGNEPPLLFREDARVPHRPLAVLRDQPEAVTHGGETCQLTGWPRRHKVVGSHCPHGMLKTLAEQEAEHGST
jgi:hypothetical protein